MKINIGNGNKQTGTDDTTQIQLSCGVVVSAVALTIITTVGFWYGVFKWAFSVTF